MRRVSACLILASTVFVSQPLWAQSPGPPDSLPSQAAPHAPTAVGPERHDVSPALRDMAPVHAPGISLFRSKRWARLPRFVRSQSSVSADPAIQSEPGVPSTPSTSTNFEGISSDDQVRATGLYVLPPDPSIDVGPNHIVQWVNLMLAVYNKSGGRVHGPVPGNTLWSGFGGACETSNDGDPIVLYDHLADRWLLSQLAIPSFPDGPFYQCIAISQTGDPLGSYHRYAFVISNTDLNDYPKFGVWPDGYYMAVNHFYCYDIIPGWGFIQCEFAGQGAYVFERSKMLDGQSAQMVGVQLPTTNLAGMLPSDLDGPAPPAGTPNYFVQVDDDAWLPPNEPGGDVDRLQVWAFTVNWANPQSSTFAQIAVLPTASFDSNMCGYQPNCIPQPGVDIIGSPSPAVDALADRLMWRLQYRYFAQGGYHTLVSNHTVDTNGADQAGIRWYELRNTGGGWQIQQQGTWAPGDGLHRWMGSIAMDSAGNMALGYSVGSLTKSPSIRYAGREATDPAGMLGAEASIVEVMGGQGYQLDSSGRWGDYNTMALDPDGCTFWYGGEYYGSFDDFYGRNWQTRIASFKFASCGAPGLPSLSINDVSLAEGNSGTTAFTFTVTLSTPSSQTVTVNYATANGSATAGSDYTGTSGSLTFEPGVTNQLVTVPVIGDTTYEADQTFFVNLSGATNATIAKSQGVGTIVNDDLPSLSIADAATAEGNAGTTNLTFTVSLTPASAQTVTVIWATSDNTATVADNDYTASSATLTFTPGQTTKTLTVPVKGDTTIEPDETFLVTLSGAVNASIVDGQAFGTIVNDDGRSIAVVRPNGNEAWVIGTSQPITWTSTNVNGNVRIELSRNGGGSWTVLQSNTSNDGSETWAVTGPATKKARIRVCTTDGTVCDQSNANFTIRR